MKLFHVTFLAGVMMSAGFAQAADVGTISGAGATFPYPIYAKWAEAYHKTAGVKLNYQSIGSGAGVKQISAKTVDFGASDDPLPPEMLKELGLIQFPAVMGAVVPVVNIQGVAANKLKLDPTLLADIYLGKITTWSDARIKTLNPGLALPDKSISVIHRSDASGTTAVFTDYLSKVSAEWKSTTGAGKSVKWLAGSMGGKGNEGVASFVKQIDGAIGYVEYAYAKESALATVQLKNRSGQYVSASAESTAAAAASADWKAAQNYYLMLTDQPGASSWPISSQTNILMYKNPENCAASEAVLKFFDWSFQNGAKLAESLEYVPLPKTLVQQVRATWADEIKCAGVAALAKSSM